VAGCVGAAFLVVFWVVFGCWFAFFGVLGSGLRVFVSLVCMALCCFFGVVVVSACCVCFGFHWLMFFGWLFCCWLSGGLGFALFGVGGLLLDFWAAFFLVDVGVVFVRFGGLNVLLP